MSIIYFDDETFLVCNIYNRGAYRSKIDSVEEFIEILWILLPKNVDSSVSSYKVEIQIASHSIV